jgi:two-component system phosphate regulon response regulator OmpR
MISEGAGTRGGDYATTPHVLVVDDDDRLRDLLSRYLSGNGFLVTTAAQAVEARALLGFFAFDAMVLDIMMPGESGLELTRALHRSESVPLPILLLTARGETADRIAGLEVGADDYLVKPFEPKELLLRLHAILRRLPPAPVAPLTLRFGRWTYDPSRDEVRSLEQTVRLTDMEARLMRVLAAEAGQTVSREALAERTRGEDEGDKGGNVNDRTIDVQVTRLRRKIEDDPKNPRYLVTVRGEGYKLLPEAGGGNA